MSNVAEAAQEAHAAVSEIANAAADAASDVAAAAIEAAEERVEAAEDAAQRIADAALQTEVGRQVTQLREDYSTWQTSMTMEISSFRLSLATLAEQVTEILSRPTVAIVQEQQQTEQSLLNPEQSAEPPLTVATVVPASVAEAVPVVQEAAPEKRAARRLI